MSAPRTGDPLPDELPQAMAVKLANDEALVRSGALQPACRSKLWTAQGTTRGVALLLHGFTAGPWQYAELGPQLAADGWAAYAVRLPGHGASVSQGASSVEDESQLPKSRQHASFGQAALEGLREANALAAKLGVPLVVVGHSAGGAMALDLLLRPDAQVARAVLVAPLLRPRRRADYALVQALGRLPYNGWLTDRVRLSWPRAQPRADGWVRPGHRRFRLGHVVALFRYARSVRQGLALALRRGTHVPPIQLVCTEGDDKVDLPACAQLAAVRPKRHFMYTFAAPRGVPHAMLTRWENPDEKARDELHRLCRDFLRTGVGRDAPAPASGG